MPWAYRSPGLALLPLGPAINSVPAQPAAGPPRHLCRPAALGLRLWSSVSATRTDPKRWASFLRQELQRVPKATNNPQYVPLLIAQSKSRRKGSKTERPSDSLLLWPEDLIWGGGSPAQALPKRYRKKLTSFFPFLSSPQMLGS